MPACGIGVRDSSSAKSVAIKGTSWLLAPDPSPADGAGLADDGQNIGRILISKSSLDIPIGILECNEHILLKIVTHVDVDSS